jgi:hypothetical protein
MPIEAPFVHDAIAARGSIRKSLRCDGMEAMLTR